MKSLSHVRLCDPMDGNLPGSAVHGIFQARILEWFSISFSRGSVREYMNLKSSTNHHREVVLSKSTLCYSDSVDSSPSGSSVHGIFQVRILEWVAISYSKQSSWPRDQTCVSCVSCMARRIIHHCATWEAPILHLLLAERPKGLLTDKLGGQECRFSDACMMCSKLLQSCPARTLKWIAMPSSRDFSQPRDRASVSYVSYTGRWVVFVCLFVCLFVFYH